MDKKEAKEMLQDLGLRATAPRLAVLIALAKQSQPLSHTELLETLGETDWDPATVYRNLVKLTEVGMTQIVSRADGMARYELVRGTERRQHEHAHFLCNDCGALSCLPDDVTASFEATGLWREAIDSATVQLQGRCPDCLSTETSR